MQFRNFKVLLTFLLIYIIYGCNFSSYTDALIPEETQFLSEEYFINIQEQYGDSFAFRFWIFQQPYSKTQNFPIQNIFQVKTKDDVVLFSEGIIGGSQQIFTLKIFLYNTYLSLLYQFYEFQNKWIFTLFTIIPSQKKSYMQTTGRNVQKYTYNQNINQQTLIFTVGNFNLQSLNQFSGKISKILFFIDFYYEETTFEKFSQQCQIPNPVNGPQTVQICDYLEQFENQNSLQSTIYVYGNRYSLSGWVKYESNLVSYYIQSLLVRITNNHIKQQQKIFGDDLFKLEVNFSNSNLFNSKIRITIDCFCRNNYLNGCKQVEQAVTYYEYYVINTTSDVIYNGLLQWHYFQYEYGRTDYKNQLMLFSIYFPNSQELIQKQFGDLQSFSFVNEYFYIFVGEKNVNYNTLTTKIKDLKFQYYYDKDLNFNIVCHPTCQICNGPFSNNCLTCKQNLNRVLQEEINQCECQKDYFQFEEEVQCRMIEDPSIKVSSIGKKDSKFCSFGQFYYPLLNGEHYCFQCPEFKQNEYNCANCLFYSQNWYLEPICSMDLLSRGKYEDDSYDIIDRDSTKIHVFYIDNLMNLNLIFGSSGFCDPSNVSDCYFINKSYLGKQIWIKCKNGFSFSDYKCTKQQTDSNIIDFYQSKDQNCSNGMFLFQNQCFECPTQCSNCYYNDIKKQVTCNNCQQGFTISNNTCVKCVQNCKICEEVYDSELKTKYIECLKCIDDSLYYLSAYGISCNRNDIPGCKYAVQYHKRQIRIYFNFNDNQQVITLCAYCGPYSEYNYQSNICKNSSYVQAEYEICYQKIIVLSSYCILSGSMLISHSFYINCANYISNCNICQKRLDTSKYICIQCQPGYYANRLNGFCDACPQILLGQNCNQCGQQQIKSQDYWTYQLRPFYRQFLDVPDIYEYIIDGQSQQQNDYEIICINCIKGYVLHNGGCIKDCPEFYKECELQNDQYKCVRCEKSSRGRSLTLFNNECIQCSENCALCRKRTMQEINEINPLFNSTEFLEYTYQCLKSYEDDQYQYDSQLGQFIQCEIEVENCENQLQIDLNLYCDQNQYEMDLIYSFGKLMLQKLNQQLQIYLVIQIYFVILVKML